MSNKPSLTYPKLTITNSSNGIAKGFSDSRKFIDALAPTYNSEEIGADYSNQINYKLLASQIEAKDKLFKHIHGPLKAYAGLLLSTKLNRDNKKEVLVKAYITIKSIVGKLGIETISEIKEFFDEQQERINLNQREKQILNTSIDQDKTLY